jgi:hypothetical protein
MDTPQAPSATTDAPQKMSWTDKLAGVFAAPGELFDNVRRSPATNSNWVVPTVVLAVVGAILGFLVISNPSIFDQFQRVATEQIDKSFQKAIAEGRMTQAQADQARSQAESFGATGIRISAVAAPLIFPFFSLFAWGLVYWLLGKGVMKATTPYLKVAEVYGLTNFIALLGGIITAIMMIGMDKFSASPSAALFVGEFSASNSWHKMAATLNIFSLWQLAVIGIGLARLFEKETTKVLVLVFALWLLWNCALIFGLGALSR